MGNNGFIIQVTHYGPDQLGDAPNHWQPVAGLKFVTNFVILCRQPITPNTYRPDIPVTWRVLPEFNVERLRSYLCRPDSLGDDSDVVLL